MLLILPLNPVPASRPRVARNGRVFYAKTYRDCKRQAEHVVPTAMMEQGGGCLYRASQRGPHVFAKRPKKTILQYLPDPTTSARGP